MTDEIRQLEKELKRKRNEMRNSNPVTKSNKYDFIGVDPEAKTTKRPSSSEVPDYIGKPQNKTSKKLPDSLPY
tara:strand:- start:4676 stop:4894 length:219 start_codon:yes stop_codon:yes gene_type:complete